MEKLIDSVCEACRADSPRVSNAEADEFLQQLPEWQIEDLDGISVLEREFTFKDFAAALKFTNKVGELAETANHHPTLVVEWGKVTVEWWTHKIGGLHKTDFVMAAKTDQLFKSMDQ